MRYDHEQTVVRTPRKAPRSALRWLIGTLLVSIAAYSAFVEPQWITVSRHQIPSKNKRPVRIVQLSDLHIREIGTREHRVLAMVGELRPDVLVLSGDVIDRPESIETLDVFLAELPSAQKVAVLGNWEYWGNIRQDRLAQLYASRGVTLLVNARADLRVNGNDIAVIGLDDFTAGHPSVVGLLAGRKGEQALLLVQHSPGYFEQNGKDASDIEAEPTLCLSGHTHGGQVSFFGTPIWTPPGSGEFFSGWYRTSRCNLYVSQGIGTSGPPIRFWSRPEVAVFDLE